MEKVNSFNIANVQSQGVASFLLDTFANFSLPLLIKVLLIKNRVLRYIK